MGRSQHLFQRWSCLQCHNSSFSTTSSPNISLNLSKRLSESDSITPSSSSDGSESSEATPITTRTSRHFNRSRNELIEKYGEEMFSNSKDEDEDEKFVKRSPVIWEKLESKNKRSSEPPSTTKVFSNKSSPSVASMCKHFENAKISAS